MYSRVYSFLSYRAGSEVRHRTDSCAGESGASVSETDGAGKRSEKVSASGLRIPDAELQALCFGLFQSVCIGTRRVLLQDKRPGCPF